VKQPIRPSNNNFKKEKPVEERVPATEANPIVQQNIRKGSKNPQIVPGVN
jgi:hypothetical protein